MARDRLAGGTWAARDASLLAIAALLAGVCGGCVLWEADRDAHIHNSTGTDLVLVLHNDRLGEDVATGRLPAHSTVPIGVGTCRAGWRVTTERGVVVKELGRVCADDDDLEVTRDDLPGRDR